MAGDRRFAAVTCGADGELVVLVGRHRRRLWWLLFVSHACVAAPAAVITAMYQSRAHGTRGAWVVVAAVVAVGVAALLAWRRRPTLRATALLLDYSLRWDERVTAALDARNDPDPVAPLIVADAVRRLQGVSPARVFPMRLRMPPAQAVAVFAAVALLAYAVPSIDPVFGPERLEPADGRSRPPTTRPDAETSAGERARAAAADSPGAATPASPRPDAPAPRAAEYAPTRAATPDDPPESEAARSSSPQEGAVDATGGSESGAAGTRDDVYRNSAIGAGDRSGSGRTARDGATSTTGAAGGDARGAAATAEGARPDGAGGIDEGRGTAGPGGLARRSEPAEARSLTVPAREEAWTRAESALSRGEVPPTWRAYVRDYFRRMRGTAPP
jgi:hypothetical protein